MSDDAKASTILKEMTQSLAVGDFLGVITLDISYLLTYGEPFAKRQAFGLRAIAFEKTGELDRCIGEYEKLLATGDVSVFEQHTVMVEIAEQYLINEKKGRCKAWLDRAIEVVKSDDSIDTGRALRLLAVLGHG